MNIKNTLRDSFVNLSFKSKLILFGVVGFVLLILILRISHTYNAVPEITLETDERVVFIQTDEYTISGSIKPKKSILTIDGEHIDVEKDGTFTYHVSLEDRRQTVTLQATNKYDEDKTISKDLLVVQELTPEELEAMKPADLGEYKVEAEDFAYMSSNHLNVFRSYADRSVVGKVYRGDIITLLEKDTSTDYCHIKKASLQGWVACGWLQKN